MLNEKPFRLPVLGQSDEQPSEPDLSWSFELPSGAPIVEGEHGYGKTYWRSIEELSGDPEWTAALEGELPEGATLPPQPPGALRRDFLKLLGASMGLAGITACTLPPQEKILPYTKTPHALTPGTPLHF